MKLKEIILFATVKNIDYDLQNLLVLEKFSSASAISLMRPIISLCGVLNILKAVSYPTPLPARASKASFL